MTESVRSKCVGKGRVRTRYTDHVRTRNDNKGRVETI